MKTIEPIPTLALDDLLHMAASAIEDLLEHTDPNTSYYSGAWADVPGKLRAAMLQAGNCRENGNSSTNNFREIAETSTGTAITPAAPDKKLTDDVQRDAKRWRALLGSARIRILGSAGFDATAHPGENPDYRHFGMEIWTHYPNWLHEKNEYGIDTLTQYADAMLAAAPQPQNAQQNIPEIIPNELIAAVNRLLDSNGSRGCYSAIRCYDAREEVERLLAAATQDAQDDANELIPLVSRNKQEVKSE